MKLFIYIVVFLGLFVPVITYACKGDDSHPILLVNEKTIINEEGAEHFMETFPLEPIPALSKRIKNGIHLKELFPKNAKSGSIRVYSCGKRMHEMSLSDLRSANPVDMAYYLVMTNKNTLKLLHAESSDKKGMSILKRIVRIEVSSLEK